VYRSSTTAQITPSVDYLLGGEKGDALRALQRKLDLVVDDLGHIRDLANIYANLEETRRGGGIEPLDASVRLIGKAVPDPVRGSTLKESLLAELRSLTADAGIPELRALRNFPVDSFTQGSTFIDSTVEAWFRSKVANPRQCTATDVAKVIGEGFQAETLWAKAVRAAVTKLLTSMDSSSASALWRWWSSSPPLIELLAPRVPMTRVAERALVDTCPVSLDRDGGEHVRKFTSTRKWVSLHACVVKAYLPWEDAIAEQLQVDVDEANTADLAWMCHSVSSSAVLDVAIASGDARLLKIAAERIESDISLKTTLDVGNPRWRTIWLLSIRAGVAPFAGIDDAASVRDALLDEVIAGEDVEELLHDLALDGELADLSGYSQREHLWPQLSPTIRQVLLLATAEGWLRRFSTPPHQADDPEPELRRMLLGSSRVRARLLEASSNVGLTLAFLRRFPDYANREALLADWIKRHPNVGRFDAATVGAFIQEHRWRSAARLVAQQADAGRGEWDYGADACVDMLGIVHRVFRRVKRGKKISLDDWWDAWIEMSSQLYPFGIRDRNIWERSAGDPSLIEVDRDGRSQWHQALRIIRHGADGVTIEGLLHQMRQDWPNNEKLETLERLWKRNELH